MLALLLVLPVQHASADWIVDVYENLGPFSHIDAAISAMQSAGPATSSGAFGVINFSQGGGPFGNFSFDSLFPGNPGDLFGVHVTGEISLAQGLNYFGINHDDGALLRFGGMGTGGIDVIDFPQPTPPINTFGSVSSLFAVNSVSVDLWLYENFGVASLELFHSDAQSTVGGLVRTIPEPGTLALLGIGLFGMGLARRRKTI